MKKILVLLLSLIFLFVYFAKDILEVNTKYECVGKFDKPYYIDSIYIKLNEYRFMSKAWIKSDATINIELPGKFFDYISVVEKTGDTYQMYDSKGELRGQFSTLSKAITVKVLDSFFDGSCKLIN